MINLIDKALVAIVEGGIDKALVKTVNSIDKSIERKIVIVDSGVATIINGIACDVEGMRTQANKFTENMSYEIKEQVIDSISGPISPIITVIKSED